MCSFQLTPPKGPKATWWSWSGAIDSTTPGLPGHMQRPSRAARHAVGAGPGRQKPPHHGQMPRAAGLGCRGRAGARGRVCTWMASKHTCDERGRGGKGWGEVLIPEPTKCPPLPSGPPSVILGRQATSTQAPYRGECECSLEDIQENSYRPEN